MPDSLHLSRVLSSSGLRRQSFDYGKGTIDLVATATQLSCVIPGSLVSPLRSLIDSIPLGENLPLAATIIFLSRYFHGPSFSRVRCADNHPGENPRSIALILPCPGIQSIDLNLGMYTMNEIAVYRALLDTEIGTTLSYESLAKRAGFPRGARFVGTTMAKNMFPILIPCHRVIRSDGTIGRYSGGGGTKRFLLNHEEMMVQHNGVAS